MFVFAATRPQERAAAAAGRPGPKRRRRLIGNTNKTRSEHRVKSNHLDRSGIRYHVSWTLIFRSDIVPWLKIL